VLCISDLSWSVFFHANFFVHFVFKVILNATHFQLEDMKTDMMVYGTYKMCYNNFCLFYFQPFPGVNLSFAAYTKHMFCHSIRV